MSRKLGVHGEIVAGTLRRHAAFWQHGTSSQPLRYTGVYSQSSPVSLPQADSSSLTHQKKLEPRMVRPDELISRIEQYGEEDLDAALALKGEYLVNVGQGDFLPLAMPLMKFPWLEAILGCPIEMTEGQIWDREYPGDPDEVARDSSSFDKNPWFQLYREFLSRLQDRLSDRFYISTSSNQRGGSGALKKLWPPRRITRALSPLRCTGISFCRSTGRSSRAVQCPLFISITTASTTHRRSWSCRN